MCEYISDFCTLTGPDIHIALAAFKMAMSHLLTASRSVHLNGLGYFSLSLKSKVPVNPDRNNNTAIEVRGVKFKPDKKFIYAIQDQMPKFIPEDRCSPETTNSKAQRLENIINYIKKNGKIKSRKAVPLNKCCFRTAHNDLRLLFREAKLISRYSAGVYFASEKLINANYKVNYEKLASMKLSR